MDMRYLARGAVPPAHRFDTVGELVQRAVGVVITWQRRCRERDQLAGLSERELRDMGMTRYEAAALARRPFWRK